MPTSTLDLMWQRGNKSCDEHEEAEEEREKPPPPPLSLPLLLLLLLLQPFYDPWTLSGTTGWAGTRKIKTGRENLSEFTGARDSEWQCYHLGHIQMCTSPRQITMSAPHHPFFTGRMHFLLLNPQCQWKAILRTFLYSCKIILTCLYVNAI